MLKQTRVSAGSDCQVGEQTGEEQSSLGVCEFAPLEGIQIKLILLTKNLIFCQVHVWPPEVATGNFDLGIVVSFGHLISERLIAAFPMYTIEWLARILSYFSSGAS